MTDPVEPPFVPGAGPRPFRSFDDIMAQMPALVRQPLTAPVRDGLVRALTALAFQCEYYTEYAAAQADVLRATSQYLDGLGGVDRGVYRGLDELDAHYQPRLVGTPDTVTERAIITGVNLILAPFTPVQCELFDSLLDRWFVNDGDPSFTWHSHIEACPTYPDRLYSGEEAQNDQGVSRPNSNPGGARVFDQVLGRHFVLRVPDLNGALGGAPFMFAAIGQNPDLDQAFYVGDGTSPDIATFINQSDSVALAVYRAIESFVNDVAGQGIRWSLFAELEAA